MAQTDRNIEGLTDRGPKNLMPLAAAAAGTLPEKTKCHNSHCHVLSAGTFLFYLSFPKQKKFD